MEIIHLEGPLQPLLHGSFETNGQHSQDISKADTVLAVQVKCVEDVVSEGTRISFGEEFAVHGLGKGENVMI